MGTKKTTATVVERVPATPTKPITFSVPSFALGLAAMFLFVGVIINVIGPMTDNTLTQHCRYALVTTEDASGLFFDDTTQKQHFYCFADKPHAIGWFNAQSAYMQRRTALVAVSSIEQSASTDHEVKHYETRWELK